MQSVLKDKNYTVKEYFQFEEISEVRHEFINGYIMK
jgi:hypothetical protein